jgi:TusA-related sulfurtransferase
MTSTSTNLPPTEQLDLRGTPCPLNFVRTKLRLEKMSPEQVLEVWLDKGEPIEQVPNSLQMAGYHIQQTIEHADFVALQVSGTPLQALE